MSQRERLVALEGALNWRDLGGYPTADGRVTKWDRIYRSDGLDQPIGHRELLDVLLVLRAELPLPGPPGNPPSDPGVQPECTSVTLVPVPSGASR